MAKRIILLKRIFALIVSVTFFSLHSIGQNTVAGALPFCTGSVTFAAGTSNTTAETGPYYGCLLTQPNPAWYYMKIGTGGSLTISMTSSPARDIDYILYGPFNSKPTPNLLTQPNQVSCGYSTNTVESATIPNAVVGQYYLLLITNFSDSVTDITFSKTAGSGSTTCNVIDAGADQTVCQGKQVTISGNGIIDPGCSISSRKWTSSVAGGSFGDDTQPNTTYTPPSSFMGNITLTYTYYLSSGCGTMSDDVVITVNLTPEMQGVFYTPPCEGASFIFAVAHPNNAYTYQWYGPNSFTSNLQTNVITNATLAMSGGYSITATLGACTSPLFVADIPIPPRPTIIVADYVREICEGNTLTLTTLGATPGATYSWVGPNGFSSALPSPTIPAITLAASGTYSVTATVNGCTSEVAEIVVSVSPPYTVNAGPDQTICVGGTAQLAGSSTAGGVWSSSDIGGIFTPDNSDPNAVFTPSHTGTITLTFTSSDFDSPCPAVFDKMLLTVISPAGISAGPDQIVCAGVPVHLAGTLSGAATSGTWTTSGTGTFNNNSPNAIYTTTETGNVILTYTSNDPPGPCPAVSDQVLITLTPFAAPSISSNSPVCQGTTLNLFAPFMANATYSWTGPNGFTSTQQNPVLPNAAAVMAGSYSLTITTGSCTLPSATTTVTEITVPVGTPVITATPGLCGNYEFSYSGNAPVGAVWNFGDATFAPVTSASIIHSYPANGVYIVTMTGGGLPTYCTVGTNVTVSGLPNADFSYSLVDKCDFTKGITINITTYSASMGYRVFINGVGSLMSAPSATFTTGLHTGANTIMFTSNTWNPFCTNSVTKTIYIGAPDASFTLNKNMCEGDVLSVGNVSSGGDGYTWAISGTTSAITGMNPSPVYVFAAGAYSVTLTITKDICTTTHTETVSVNTHPNAAFTLSNASCNGAVIVNLPANPGGITSYTLSYGDGTVLTGAAYTSGNQTAHTYSNSGVYPIIFTVENGACKNTYSQNVQISNLANVVVSASSTKLCPGSSIMLEALLSNIPPNAGAVTYSWAGPGLFSSSQPQIHISTAGIYTVTVTSAGPCVLNIVKTKSIMGLAAPTASVVATSKINCSQTTGSATLEIATPSVQQGYTINGVLTAAVPLATAPVQVVVTGLSAGDNYIKIENGMDKSCSGAVLVHLDQDLPLINLQVTQPATCGGTGSASAAPVPNIGTVKFYTSANYPQTPLASTTALMPGSYVVELINANCKVTEHFTIVAPVINLSLSNNDPGTCSIGVPETVNAQFSPPSISGPFTYSWSGIPPVSPGNVNNTVLQVGSYTVNVSAHGCTSSIRFNVKPLPPITVSLDVKKPICFGDPAQVTAQASGGDGNYTYNWFNGATTPTITLISSLLPKTVSVTVSDASGCSGVSTNSTVIPATDIKLRVCTAGADLDEPNLGQAVSINGCNMSVCLHGGSPDGTPSYKFEWYRVGETSYMVERQFGLFLGALQVLNSDGTYTPVPVPASASDVTNNIYKNSDGNITTFYYPAWTFTVSPAVPQLTSTGEFYTVKETIVNSASEIPVQTYYGGEINTTSTGPFLTGDYVLYVTDDNGCRKKFNVGHLNFDIGMTTPAFTFVWGWDPKPEIVPDPEDEVDPVLADNVAEAANEMLNEASSCMASQSKNFGDSLEITCSDLTHFRDEFGMTYQIKEGHYTLYYYDRAGQLTKTVPPQGIEPLTSAQIKAIEAYRKDNTSTAPAPFDPAHRMATTYQYNSLAQLISQNSPDGGTSTFIYDGKSRLRFSQNAKQQVSGAYSYTKYDELGRIMEVGESSLSGLSFSNLGDANNLTNANDPLFPVSGNAQITHTVYSNPSVEGTYYGKPPRNLQNRVSYVYTDEDGDPNTANDMSYTYYSYDTHGNVEWLVQQNPEIGKNYVAYDYDLVSGKVLQVKYNENREDRFFHKYSYDAINRLTKTETSRDGILWDADATYAYYAHGPLKRNVIGEDHVQGLDYVYTIQGWIKSINTPGLNTADDPGADDGIASPGFQNVAQDRFGMMLNYYRGDYTRTDSKTDFLRSTRPTVAAPVPTITSVDNLYASVSANPDFSSPDLYNGNISSWQHSQLDKAAINGTPLAARADVFRYDVLNRIKQNIDKKQNGNSWDILAGAASTYSTSYTYDANGNILNLQRYDDAGAKMDDLSYTYDGGAEAPAFQMNRLSVVHDNKSDASTNQGKGDLEGDHTYTYDKIGNLITDVSLERLHIAGPPTEFHLYTINTSIAWTVYGKIKEINKVIDPSGVAHKERIRFSYDASGNRTKKEVWIDRGGFNGTEDEGETVTTYYVRDAQGNILAVYNKAKDETDNLFKYKLIEQPIYGSDRIGQNSSEVTLISASTASALSIPGDGRKTISEYQNWITTTNKTQLLPGGGTDQLCECKIKSLHTNTVTNTYTLNPTNPTAAEFLGVADNGIAIAENLEGELQFYVVLAKKYLGNNDACLIYDKEGKLMKGTEDIGKINADCKPIIINIPGSKKYAVVTLNNKKVPVYHVVDMNLAGYLVGGVEAGAVSAHDLPMTDYSGITPVGYAPKHGWHFTAVEDHISGTSIVYNTRYTLDKTDPKRGTTEIVAYEFGNDPAIPTPIQHVLYSINGCGITEAGELQVSPKGDKLLWFQYDKNVSGFDYRTADIYILQLGFDKLSVDNVDVKYSISPAGNYGKGMAEFMKNNNDILFSQRGVYAEGSGATKYDRNVWKFTKVPTGLPAMDPGNINSTYLFSQIKRGVDGNYYMPDMGAPADKIHSYSGTSFNADVNLAEAGYELASSLPTQVYKIFTGGSSQVPVVYERAIGKKQYELKDHLGDVCIVISDEKKVTSTDNIVNAGDVFTPNVLSSNDYYAFGMQMPGRSYSSNSYRYGFNGQEKDNEIKGEGNSYDFLFRCYDPRIGRFLSTDPLTQKFPALSCYQHAGNNPIAAIDLEGLEPATVNPNTQVLVLVLQGFGGDPQKGKTQAQNAGGDLDIDYAGLGQIQQAASGATQIQVVTFASSTTDNTKEDVKKTIEAFKAQNAGGQVVLVGHSQGADNIVELAKENKSLNIDLLITLDIKDASNKGIFSVDDDNIPSNVKFAINYYQEGEFIGGEKIEIDNTKTTQGANILSPGSNHRSIDNDIVPYVIQDINNLTQGKNPVTEAKSRTLPTFVPANTNSQDVTGKSKSTK